MARVNSYTQDGSVNGSDTVLGTDVTTGGTKNFSLNSITGWMNDAGAVRIIGQSNYKFQADGPPVEDRRVGSISFEAFGGDGTLFTAITELIFSGTPAGSYSAAAFIETLVGKRVIIADLSEPANFGIYNLNSYTELVNEPGFYRATFTYLSGSGTLINDRGYGLTPYGIESSDVNRLTIGTDPEEGLTDALKDVYDGTNKQTRLRLSTNKFEVNQQAIVRAGTNPVLRMVADNPDNPTLGETMGTLRFTRNFEDPLALDLARAIFSDFTERVTADGGTVEGTEECVASELELIVSGEYLINMADIKPEYVGSLASTKADLVFYLNDGGGAPEEKFRITQEGNIEVKDSLSGVVIRSRNDTPYRILVDNDGRLEATALDAAAPVINGVPTISGIVAITEIITATKASVTSSPALTTTYQWQVSDNGTTGWINISGATSSTYLIPLEYANKFLRVQQIETNILGQTTANSASTTAVIPSLLVSAMIQRLGNFENETYVYDSLVDFDAIELS